jgi:DNA-binding MarR family transcriptional regulator
MAELPLDEQAHYIFTTGRAIRDFVDHNIASQLAQFDGRSIWGELSVTQMHALMMIQKRETVSISELASLLGVSVPSASTLVDRLVEKGALTREPSLKDRRRMEVRIASALKDDFSRVNSVLLNAFANLIQKIGPETTRMWCEVLRRIEAVLEQEERPVKRGKA